MPSRTIAIGDIHGCSAALAALIEMIAPQSDETIITLGDYVDRGIDSKGVLDFLIALADRCCLIPLLGNHDEMMLDAKDHRSDLKFWLNRGGDSALDSYGSTTQIDLIPVVHFQFLKSCLTYFETETHFFVHANYLPEQALDRQDERVLRWLSLRDFVPGPHCSGKIAVVGHTVQDDVLDLGHLLCIDTGCYNGGWLTALDVTTGDTWQVDERGSRRVE